RRRPSISLLGGAEVTPAPPKENERVPWKARPWERFGAARRGPESQRWRGSTRLQGKTGEPLGDFRKVWVASCATAARLLFHDLPRSAVRNMVRAGVPERRDRRLRAPRAVFDRYNIVSENDVAAAADQTLAYIEANQDAPAIVVPLVARRARHKHRQNTDNRGQAGTASTPAAATA